MPAFRLSQDKKRGYRFKAYVYCFSGGLYPPRRCRRHDSKAFWRWYAWRTFSFRPVRRLWKWHHPWRCVLSFRHCRTWLSFWYSRKDSRKGRRRRTQSRWQALWYVKRFESLGRRTARSDEKCHDNQNYRQQQGSYNLSAWRVWKT